MWRKEAETGARGRWAMEDPAPRRAVQPAGCEAGPAGAPEIRKRHEALGEAGQGMGEKVDS